MKDAQADQEQSSKRPAHERLLDATGKWLKSLDDVAGWREFQRSKIAFTLRREENDSVEAIPNEFKFPPRIEREHAAVFGAHSVLSSYFALKDCEFYFRRYPFSDLPITKDTHLRYMCEMYFSRFYEFRERLKKCLNAVSKTILPTRLDVGKIIKLFDRDFGQELRARHQIHHREAFDDVGIGKVALSHLMSLNGSEKSNWLRSRDITYRRESAEWATRVRNRSERVLAYVDAVAEAMLEHCEFLPHSDRDAGKEI